MTVTEQQPVVAKKARNWSRQTKFKIRRTGLLKNPHMRQAITRARINRILRQQNINLAKGKEDADIYTAGLETVTRISQRASEATAQLIERFLMNILQDAGAAAAHAGRVTIKETDLALAMRRFKQ